MAGKADARSGSDAGFTIIEVVVAMTILVIAFAGAAKLFGNAITVSGNTRARVVAQNLVTQEIEKVRGAAADPTKFVAIPEGRPDPTYQTVNGQKYTIQQEIQWVSTTSSLSACDSSGVNGVKIMAVTETVTWAKMAGTAPVSATTSLAAPVGAYAANTGGIAVKVLNAAGAPSASINVRIQGPSGTDNQQSTSQGCAFWPYLAAGTYTVSITEGTGVGDQNELVPSQQTSVSVGQTASLQFAYDTSGTIVFDGYTNETVAPPVSGLAMSVANTGLQPYGQYSYGVAVSTLTPVFPYTSGYTVFAGQCTDNNPLGKDNTGNPLYPTAAPTPINVPAAGTTHATAPLYRLDLKVTRSGSPVASVPVTMVSKSYSTPSVYATNCTSGTANIPAPTLTAGSTDASGLRSVAIPLGHFTITASKVISGTTRTGTLNIWSKPDGVYAVDANGNAGTKYTAPITIALA